MWMVGYCIRYCLYLMPPDDQSPFLLIRLTVRLAGSDLSSGHAAFTLETRATVASGDQQTCSACVCWSRYVVSLERRADSGSSSSSSSIVKLNAGHSLPLSLSFSSSGEPAPSRRTRDKSARRCSYSCPTSIHVVKICVARPSSVTYSTSALCLTRAWELEVASPRVSIIMRRRQDGECWVC